MRHVRFRTETGAVHSGEWTDRGIEFSGKVYSPEEVDVLPPSEPSKVLGVGPNHVSNVETTEDYEWPESPEELYLFVKTVPHSLVAHGDTVLLAEGGTYIFELELGVVVGTQCKDVSRADAEDVIRGYTIVNEITNTDVPEGFEPTNAARAKSFDGSAPVGPVVATPDLVPADAAMELRVDGEVRQRADRTDLIFSEAELIEEISAYFTLEPGDVIATGSPTGAAPLEDGDHVEVEIEGIGTLEHDVRIE